MRQMRRFWHWFLRHSEFRVLISHRDGRKTYRHYLDGVRVDSLEATEDNKGE